MHSFNWEDHENLMNAFKCAGEPEEISRQAFEREATDFQEHVNAVIEQWQAYQQETDGKIQHLVRSFSLLIKENPLFHVILKNCESSEASLTLRKNEMARLSEALQMDQATLERKKEELEKIRKAFKQLQKLLILQQAEKTPFTEFFEGLTERASQALSNKLRELH